MAREALTPAQMRDYDGQRSAHPDKPLVVLVSRTYGNPDGPGYSQTRSSCCFKRDEYVEMQRWADWWLSCRPEGSTGYSVTVVQEAP